MTYKSFPKVNLFLLVGKRSKKNNLHKLCSVFLLIKDSIFDEVEINFNNESKNEILYVDLNENTIQIENCIFVKTINYLKEKSIINKNAFFKIKVKKNMPLFSGLGSGSSNVACLFKFLLKQKMITNKQINKNILNIGSDVLFFIKDYDAAFVYKYGEKVIKIKNPKLKIKLFFTDIKCSTKNVFEYFDKNSINNKKYYLKQFLYFKIKRYEMLKNDLQESAYSLYKNLFFKSSELEKKYNKKVFLAGSGGTLFLIENY